ncbi:universal stress protein [Winogradskyella sp.]|uniref:universal stress protein n=1 Tax=Winogradskyella sp. TaxID=1883156 RepID=UPI003F6A9923
MNNILVALDFNGNEQQLIDTAINYAQAFDAKLWLLHIVAPNPDFVGYEAGPQFIRDNRASQLKKERELLDNYSDSLEEKGIKAEGLMVQGATIETIMEESKKLNIKLIIVGHSERSMLYKAIFGRVASSVIKASNIPVLTVQIE